MARVSSDTDRLCNFLSLNLVDFATDILMILMTAGHPADASTRCWPWRPCARSRSSSGWSYRVRGRLLRGYRQGGVAWADMTSVLADTIPGIRVVKAFAQERREIERFDAQQRPRRSRPTTASTASGRFFGPTVTLLTTLRPAGRLGLRLLARLPRRTSRSAC